MLITGLTYIVERTRRRKETEERRRGDVNVQKWHPWATTVLDQHYFAV
jgi:hypothetical protein